MTELTGKKTVNIFNKYLEQIEIESDRGAVIIASSIIDIDLENLIKSKLLKNNSKLDKLFDGVIAPLGTLSSKIEFAFRLGLIREEVVLVLNSLKKIRNKFAHSIELNTLDDNEVKNILFSILKNTDLMRTLIKSFINVSKENSLLEVNESNFFNKIPIRKIFNFYFAFTAMAINRVSLQVKRIDILE